MPLRADRDQSSEDPSPCLIANGIAVRSAEVALRSARMANLEQIAGPSRTEPSLSFKPRRDRKGSSNISTPQPRGSGHYDRAASPVSRSRARLHGPDPGSVGK